MKTGRQIGATLLAAALSAALLAGCGTAQSNGSATGSSTAASAVSQQAQPGSTSQGEGACIFTDAVGNTVTVESTDRVVATYGSYAETWTLAGGTLVGATQDAIEERGMDLGEEVAIIGTVKEPNLEEIIAEDPDYIFITTMGSEQQAMDYMAQNVENNPAWQQLTAVQNDRCLTLPKDLFHYKPNARWGESYAYLAKILYPDLAGQIG